MTERERLEQRLTALERTVIDGDGAVGELAEIAEIAEAVERLESRIDEQEQRLARVEARAESLTGFVDDVESVNEDVERRAAAAVATVDRLERRLDDLETALERDQREADGLERADSIDSDRCRDRQLAEATTGASESTARENGSVTPESTVAEIVGSEDENGDGDEATAGIGNSDGDETAESTGVIATIRKTLP